ncbi:MAG: Cell wall-associated hydrolases (invasion-associated proteins) [Rhodobacteraceae bacterium HLUCCA12]|nr:MAG: Cell wall-associated hydrolases (invasion-associated proteins) [Rhodobacteraceae bacterium HLUCCA12]
MTGTPDRRFHRANHRIAHVSLRGALGADLALVAGAWHRVAAPLADLCAEPGARRDRQLLLGTRFCALDQVGAQVFGYDADDGYCGWLSADALGPDHPVTHWVSAPATHRYTEASIKSAENAALSFGARINVLGVDGPFATTPQGHIPLQHIRPIGEPLHDPVGIARLFLGTPYLWGGNSRSGIDCSGLIQAAHRGCGRACPPDSDLQAAMPGDAVAAGHEVAGDLLFWTGHVALVSAPGMIIHANAWHMATVEEPLSEAEARIAANGEPVQCRLRPRAQAVPAHQG